MANGLSLKVLLQLQKKQFDSGIKSVQRQLSGFARSIRNVSSMLAGGLGFAQIVSHMKNTAKEMSMFKATLENVSNGYKEYSQNLEFLDRIANRYGQDLIALGQSYARFRAAAKTSNLSLDQQRDIFEALTRAAGAYHLSAEQTQMAMLAVEQMLNKGVVAAEELRRQLGQYIPGAFNLMAKAAGMAGITLNGTTKELQDAMKAGKVVAEEVLPHFAQVLKTVTSAANFDSLVSSTNRFSNAWTKFVNNSEFTSVFKQIVDFGTNSLNRLSNSTQKFFRTLITIGSAILTWSGAKKIPAWFDALREKGFSSLSPFQKEVKGALSELNEFGKQIDKIEKQLNILYSGKGYVSQISVSSKEDLKILKQTVGLTKDQERYAKNIVKAGGTYVYAQKQGLTQQKAITYLEAKQNMLMGEASVLSDKLAYNYGLQVGQVRKISIAWAGVKSILQSVGPLIAISIITNIVTKVIQLNKELKKYKTLLETSNKEIEKAGSEAKRDIEWVERQYEIARNTAYEYERRVTAAKEVKKALNDTTTPIEDILDGASKVSEKIKTWSANIRKAAKEAALFNKITELEENRLDLQQKIDEENAKPQNPVPPVSLAGAAVQSGLKLMGVYDRYFDPAKVSRYKKELEGVDRAINGLFETANREGLTNPFTGDGMDTGIDAVKAIKTALDEYKKSAEDLKNSLVKGKISHSKYNRDLNKLRDTTFNTIKAFSNYEDVIEGLDDGYKKLFKQLDRASNLEKTKSDFEIVQEALDNYAKKTNELNNQFKAGAVSVDEYAKAQGELAETAFKSISSFGNLDTILAKLGSTYIGIASNVREAYQEMLMMAQIEKQLEANDKALENEMDALIDKLVKYNEKSGELMAAGIPKKNQIEGGRFAYKDGFADSLREYARNSEDYVKRLEKYKSAIEGLRKYGNLDPFMQSELEKVTELLAKARVEMNSLVDAADFAEVSEDIKQLKEDLAEAEWDAWSRGILGASETIWNSVKRLMEAFGGDEWEEIFGEEAVQAFDRLFSVLGALSDIVKTVSDSFELYNNVMKISTKLTQAQEAETAILKGTQIEQGAAQVASQIQQAAAETSSAGVTVGAEAAKQTAINATSTALAGQAVAGAAASQASIPYVGPILAAAAVAAIVGLLAANMKKFKDGGIVGGNSYTGDNQTVAVGSREMILNRAQQAHLWNMLTGKEKSGNGQVEFVLRGDRLVGAIQNYQNKRRG